MLIWWWEEYNLDWHSHGQVCAGLTGEEMQICGYHDHDHDQVVHKLKKSITDYDHWSVFEISWTRNTGSTYIIHKSTFLIDHDHININISCQKKFPLLPSLPFPTRTSLHTHILKNTRSNAYHININISCQKKFPLLPSLPFPTRTSLHTHILKNTRSNA